MAGASAWRQKPQAVSTLDLKWRDTYGECSSEEERRIVAPEVEISKFFTYPKWKNGREADGAILERWWTERFRGFESHFFLHIGIITWERA